MSPHPIGITELDTGRCLEVNDACLQVFGFDRHEVIGKTTLMLGIWPDPRERAKLIQQLTSGGSVRGHEVSMRVKSGELRQFLISIDLIRLKRKQCLLTIGTDITERKRAEEQLRSNHRFISEMTSVLPGILYIFDLTEQRNVYVNRHTGVALGYSTEEVHSLGADFISTVLHPDDVSRMHEHFEILKRQGMASPHAWSTDFGIATARIGGSSAVMWRGTELPMVKFARFSAWRRISRNGNRHKKR